MRYYNLIIKYTKKKKFPVKKYWHREIKMIRLIIRSHESENILIRYELVKENTKNRKQQLLVFYLPRKLSKEEEEGKIKKKKNKFWEG